MSAEFVKQTLSEEQERNMRLQTEHEQLLQKQEVLQEELQMALNNYQPKAMIDAGACVCVCVCVCVCADGLEQLPAQGHDRCRCVRVCVMGG